MTTHKEEEGVITKIEIDLKSLLHSLEEGSDNPNCYEETGKIRRKFRESDKTVVTICPWNGKSIDGKSIVTITRESKQSL